MPHTAVSLMLQGTASHVGKTLLVLALCRSLYRRGLKVCPFKPQNITSSHLLTPRGEALGMAQYLQALACGMEPSACLNPVLIETSAEEAVFYLCGQRVFSGTFRAYERLLPDMQAAVEESYIELQSSCDVVLVEGAGSPAEPNRRTVDLANMWFARRFSVPVVVVASLLYGGTFASLVGTFELLPPDALACVRGFVLNGAAGGEALLRGGTDLVEQRYGKPCLCAFPFLPDLRIPEEDGLLFSSTSASSPLPPDWSETAFLRSADRLADALEETPFFRRSRSFFPL